jgi:hypothetical protein
MKKDLKESASQPILPPRVDSLIKHDKHIGKPSSEKVKKHKAILPPTRGLKHGTLSSPTPILPPIKQSSSQESSALLVPKHHSSSKKRPFSTTEASDSSEPIRTTSSKRRRNISLSGSPISPDDKKSMLTDKEEWEVTTGRFRGSVNLSADKDVASEIVESKCPIYTQLSNLNLLKGRISNMPN